ncbi:hypothetical protein ACFL2H_03920 [Planctomycetota bacterium]
MVPAAGALQQMHRHSMSERQKLWHYLKTNSRAILSWFDQPRQQLPNIDPSLQSGVTLLRVPDASGVGIADLRQTLAYNRTIASAFPERLVRLSMPKIKLPLSQITTMQRAFLRLEMS